MGPFSVVTLTESAHLLRPGGVPFQPAQALGEHGVGTTVLSHPFLCLDPQLHAVAWEKSLHSSIEKAGEKWEGVKGRNEVVAQGIFVLSLGWQERVAEQVK